MLEPYVSDLAARIITPGQFDQNCNTAGPRYASRGRDQARHRDLDRGGRLFLSLFNKNNSFISGCQDKGRMHHVHCGVFFYNAISQQINVIHSSVGRLQVRI